MKKKITVREILDEIDALKTNSFTVSQKISWIEDIEGRILCEIHNVSPENLPEIYREADTLTVLKPYSRLYSLYLASMIDFYSGEAGQYEKAKKEFDKAYLEYAKWYLRNK